MDALFLDHYDRELAYLREMGSEFASKYPKLAGRLGLDEFSCSDPFVERLLEGFAFMSARIQRRLDAEFPQLTRAIIDSVFPHYGRPLPSAGIFQINPALDEGSLIDGYLLPRGTRLHAAAARGQQTGCRFDTTSDLQLWPLKIVQAKVFSRDTTPPVAVPTEFHRSAIRSCFLLTLETTIPVPFEQLKLDCLKIHLRGGEIGQQLFELLLAHSETIAIAAEHPGEKVTEDNWKTLEHSCFVQTGMQNEDSLLPEDNRSFSGYRSLQEYFMLPEKFLFLELTKLAEVTPSLLTRRIHILVGLDQLPASLVGRLTADHIGLHCVPAVNLFRRRSDRIHLDHSQHEHQLISDRSRPLDYEVWSIKEMAGHAAASAWEVPCLPIYAPPGRKPTNQQNAIYYSIERRPRLVTESSKNAHRSAYLGSEVFVSLTDSHQMPSRQDIQQLSSILYCTNRDLSLLPPESGWRHAFSVESAGPIANVVCLTGPTVPRNSLVSDDGDAAWRLVSHLTPNYLSLTDNDQGGAAMLRELLQLYCNIDDQSSAKQIEGVLSIRHHSIVCRVPGPGPLTHARGIEIEVACDEEAFEGGRAFLLGSILDQFFARFVNINSFTQMHLVSTQRGTIHRWPSRIGSAPLM